MDEHSHPAPPLSPELEELTLALLHSRGEVERLREREHLFSSLLDSVNTVLWAFDWDAQRIIYVSPAYERVFGRNAGLLLADYGEWLNCIYPDDVEHAAASFAEVLVKGAVEDREYRILRPDGQLRWLSDKCFISRQAEAGKPLIVVGIAEDITDKKHLEGELHRLATTDVLTQSSNRRYFFECAHSEFQQATQEEAPLAFLLLDVDNFKHINDTYGHPMGDVVLQRIAQCGSAALRRGDLFGRIGGEEFAALFPCCTEELALQIAERLQREIQRLVFSCNGTTFGVTVSQGLTSLTRADATLDTLFARADAAMYDAKRQGKNRIIRA
jgi:diguanylate cyclase (GGDEF)-like protein/PAS domain S-box-containing protein